MNNKTVLVTGGAGAIGSNMVARLADRSNTVVVLDNLSSGSLLNLTEHKNVNFVFGNVEDQSIVSHIFERYEVDHVFHLAAHFANQNSIDHPRADLLSNGLGTLNLLEASKEAGVSSFLLASTSCIQIKETEHDHSPDASNFEYELDTPYAIHKLLGEHYIRFYAQFYEMNCNAVRFFNIYGPGERPGKYRNVIPNFINLALSGQPLTITGTGEETRSFTFVEEAVDACIDLSMLDGIRGEVINVGSNVETDIKTLAETINDLTGNEAGVEFLPRRNWDRVSRRTADISRAKELIGFEPRVPLREGLEKTHQWIKEITREG